MMSRRNIAAAAVALLALATVACGTRVGKQSTQAPKAVITAIGYKPTSAAGADPVTITVRSGADVILSGKDSDGVDVALKTFTWELTAGQLPALPDAGALLYRTSNTVSFRAPDVKADTVLSFRLTVTNALDVAGTATINVTVKPASDSDQFLVNPGTANHFTVAIVTTDGFGTSATSALSADLAACVQVQRQVSYLSRDGTMQSVTLTQLPALQADATWGAGTVVQGAPSGSDSDVQAAVRSYSNPLVTFDIPSFNDEELFAMFNQPSNFQLAKQLVTADVDKAQLKLTIAAKPGPCGTSGTAPANTGLIVALLDGSGKVVLHSTPSGAGQPISVAQDNSGTALTPDWLNTHLNYNQPVQTAELATAYYKAIDPNAFTANDPKATLSGWLAANCFDPAAADYGTGNAGANGAHAVYTNNFDLGFGRDMYYIKCSSGDMASVVINYPSLEQAALKSGAFNAVAMEYSAAADGSNPGHRFAKFYIFAPDDRTGEFKRVLSANFDRRGQKYVPGACTSCHGGTLPALQAGFSSATSPYPAIQDPKTATLCGSDATSPTKGCLSAGNVDSAFLPWDLDSFLYSDTDPAFKGNLVPGTAYTRSAQAAALKALNVLAYGTWQDPETETVANGTATVQVDRFLAPKRLVEQWYGGPGLPNANYDDSNATVPTGWQGQEGLYHNVFARTCRTCHVANPKPAVQFSGSQTTLTGDGYQTFLNEFTTTSATVHGKPYIFSDGLMPVSRLTMDRFWVNFDGGDSAAKTLATAVQQATGETDLLSSSGDAVPTGTPVLSLLIDAKNADANTGKFAAKRFLGARADGSGGFFISQYDWTLCVVTSPGATCAAVPLSGITTSKPGFDTSKYCSNVDSTTGNVYCNYQLTLNGQNTLAQAVSRTYEIDVPIATPSAAKANCPSGQSATFNPAGLGPDHPVSISSCFTAFGDPPYKVLVSYDGSAGSYLPSVAGVEWNARVVPGAASTDPVTGRDNSVPSIIFNFTQMASATGNNRLHYQLCDTDNVCASGDTPIALAGSLTPVTTNLLAYWDPALDPNGPISISAPPGALAINAAATPCPKSYCASLSRLGQGLTLNVPSNDTVTLSFDSIPPGALATGTLSANPLQGTPASILTQVMTLNYAPQPGCVTIDVTNAPVTSCGGTVALADALTASSVTTPPAPGRINIDVQALASFGKTSSSAPTSVFGIISSTCTGSGCHSAGGTGSTAWTYTPAVSGDPVATAAAIAATHSSIQCGHKVSGTCQNDLISAPPVPTNSHFYTALCGTASQLVSTMSSVSFYGTAASQQCQIIYQWILEGGLND